MRQILEVASHYTQDVVNFGVPFPFAGRPPQTIEEAVQRPSTNYIEHVVFKNRNSLKSCLKELKDRDLGISIVISAPYEDTEKICKGIGLSPHSVALSMGIHGKTERLPGETILEITTMCGHGLVASNLAQEMIKQINKGKMTYKEAASELSRQCVCGVFNPFRAERLLKKIILK